MRVWPQLYYTNAISTSLGDGGGGHWPVSWISQADMIVITVPSDTPEKFQSIVQISLEILLVLVSATHSASQLARQSDRVPLQSRNGAGRKDVPQALNWRILQARRRRIDTLSCMQLTMFNGRMAKRSSRILVYTFIEATGNIPFAVYVS